MLWFKVAFMSDCLLTSTICKHHYSVMVVTHVLHYIYKNNGQQTGQLYSYSSGDGGGSSSSSSRSSRVKIWCRFTDLNGYLICLFCVKPSWSLCYLDLLFICVLIAINQKATHPLHTFIHRSHGCIKSPPIHESVCRAFCYTRQNNSITTNSSPSSSNLHNSVQLSSSELWECVCASK